MKGIGYHLGFNHGFRDHLSVFCIVVPQGTPQWFYFMKGRDHGCPQLYDTLTFKNNIYYARDASYNVRT